MEANEAIIDIPEKAAKPTATTAAVPALKEDEWIFLSGRPPLQEFLGFVATQFTDPQSLDLGALTTEWLAANARVQQVEAAEAGWPDNPVIAPIDPALTALSDQVLNDPMFKRSSPFSLGVHAACKAWLNEESMS